jgi:hypothetical protein
MCVVGWYLEESPDVRTASLITVVIHVYVTFHFRAT